jgi:isopenicillin N synthase-like dioxygenase
MPHSDRSVAPHDTFWDLPPFPNNVPTAPLLRISLEQLLRRNEEEQERCWKACCELGFFYLDLRTSATDTEQATDGGGLLHDANRLFEVMKGFFDLEVQEKIKFDFKDRGSYFGYKGYGDGFIDKQGTRDRNEFYNVQCPLSMSSGLTNRRPLDL